MSVLLQKPIFDSLSNRELVQQIESAKKAKDKLPTWFNCTTIYYPPKLHIEQTSSELTANYKSNLIAAKRIADLSGGLGVDSYYFSKNAEAVNHFEINPELALIVKHNFKALEASNIFSYAADGIDTVLSSKETYDLIYIDPDRRDKNKNRVYFLTECLPNVPKHLDKLFEHSNNILIKSSPLLDISQGLKELSGVKQIIALAVKNELKELLWILEKDYNQIPTVKAVNLNSDQREFTAAITCEEHSTSIAHSIEEYLYEPNVALLKTGMFKTIAQTYQLHKLHSNTHLYTSSQLVDFPGRVFKIKEVLKYNKKNLKPFEKTKANISCRNFKLSVDQLRKKHRINDGGASYLFFTTDCNNKAVVVVCNKV